MVDFFAGTVSTDYCFIGKVFDKINLKIISVYLSLLFLGTFDDFEINYSISLITSIYIYIFIYIYIYSSLLFLGSFDYFETTNLIILMKRLPENNDSASSNLRPYWRSWFRFNRVLNHVLIVIFISILITSLNVSSIMCLIMCRIFNRALN